jgi:formylglycine-generating enzyme required for sulfatase activity
MIDRSSAVVIAGSAFAAIFASGFPGCTAGTPGPRLPVAATQAARLEPFTQQVPGTLLSIDLVPVPEGDVIVGEGEDAHVETVGPFWIARTETTWDLYDVFVFEREKPAGGPEVDAVARPSRPYVPPDRGFGHEGYAAISVSYRGADHFCRWLSALTGRTYRLPTEAEWVLACTRGGVGPETAADHGWFEPGADGAPHAVGTKRFDALGLADMWGNVAEWCTGPEGTPVSMGGSFRDPLDRVGCGARALPAPAWQVTDPQVPKSPWWLSDAPFAGFRIVCLPDERPAPAKAAQPGAPAGPVGEPSGG